MCTAYIGDIKSLEERLKGLKFYSFVQVETVNYGCAFSPTSFRILGKS